MSGGSGGTERVPPTMPDFEQPPAVIEGPGGGPAFPVGGGMSAQDKEWWDEVSDTCWYVSEGATVAAGGSVLMGPEAWPAAGVWGVAAGVWGIAAQLASDISEDPPQPAYQRVVEFRQRVCVPPGLSHPVLGSLGIAAQRGLFLAVTARGYLDAIERLQGAQAAQDLDWAIVHKGTAVQARWASAVDLATWAAALLAVGKALAGTRYDFSLPPGARAGTAWLADPRIQAELPDLLRRGGLTAAEVEATLAHFRGDPVYRGPASTVSAQLTAAATRLYGVATRLAA